MSFKNPEIDAATLPRADELDLKSMADAYPREVLVSWLIFAVPLCAILMAVGFIPFPARAANIAVWVVFAVQLIVFVLLGVLFVKQAHARAYALREHDLVFQSGLFWRKRVVLPFNRVQHAKVSSGPLERRYGLATVKFFTADGTSVDLKISGLERQQAEALREFVLERSGGESAQR